MNAVFIKLQFFGERILVASVLVLFLHIVESEACTFRSRIPISSSVDEFVFVGTVLGYTEPIPFPQRIGTEPNADPAEGAWFEARGLRLKVKDSVSVRRQPREFFEVYPYFHSGVCSPLGVHETWLHQRYPIGMDVIVVAELSSFVPFDAAGGNLRLEISPSTGALSGAKRYGNYEPTALSHYDYALGARGGGHDLTQFEMRKDLIRLEASDPKARQEIIDRILNIRDWYSLDLFSLLRKFVPNKQQGDRMYEEKLIKEGWDKKRLKLHLECVQGKADSPTDMKRNFPC
jgi:hypothetical protein